MGRAAIEAPKIQQCVLFIGDMVLSGGDNGGLYLWKDGTYE
jgi:hypothetical protein